MQTCRIVTVFDEGTDHPGGLVHTSGIGNTLRRIFPDPLFFDYLGEGSSEEFQKNLPLLKWRVAGSHLSLFFLSRHRIDSSKFFYDMICRFLMPGKKVDVAFFFTTDFRLPELDSNFYTLAEMVVRLDETCDRDQVVHNLHVIETEVRLGMVSVYHATRILEVHTSDEKSAQIQEKISQLIQKRPDEIDYDIFGEMQHFFVMSKEEFKMGRDAHHLSRLIGCFYIFRKSLERAVELEPEKRHVRLKLSAAHLDLAWGFKRVLGICVGLNFLRPNEIFEERHLSKAVKNALPSVKVVDNSFFVNEADQIHTLYLEVEKEDGSEFSLAEIRKIRHFLPEELKRSIETVLKPVFMPRNEEEVIRNIVTLAKELRFVRDLPQVILTFEEQREADLVFNVILVRVLFPDASSIQELFVGKETFLTYVPDRVKRIGMVRKRYPKEATVFQVKFASQPFVRDDHSVDLYRARQALISELQRIIGNVRDYSGGMIAKQLELLSHLKGSIGEMSRADEALLEGLFHSLFPVEMRSFVSPEAVKRLFFLWKELIAQPTKKELVRIHPDATYLISREERSFTSEADFLIAKPVFGEERFWGYVWFGQDKNFTETIDANV